MKIETAIFANGCFWCTEAIFQKLKGVEKVVPGYTGGITQNPTYQEVCTGNTLHAEAIKLIFDADVLSYRELLGVFFTTHDPTSLNRQGEDIGTQYRSEIFYLNDDQKKEALAYIDRLNKEAVFDKPIVTKVTEASIFYEAENYHWDYFTHNGDKTYCAAVIAPKVEKFRKQFKDHLKE